MLVERDDFNNDGKVSRFEKFRNRFLRFINRMMPYRAITVLVYPLVITGLAILMLNSIGQMYNSK